MAEELRRFQMNVPRSFPIPNISSISSRRFATSFSSMLTKITPSGRRNSRRRATRGCVMHATYRVETILCLSPDLAA